MDPGEFLSLVVVLVAFPWVLFTGIRNIKREKYRAQAQVSDSGMRVSELRALIREAVSEAVEPLEARVRALEQGARAEAPAPPVEARAGAQTEARTEAQAAPPRPLLDPSDWDDEDLPETAARASRRTRL